MNIFLFCSAVLVILFGGLSFNVSRMRLKRSKFPDLPETEVTKAIRAQGNAAEYIPLFVVLFLYANTLPPNIYWVMIAIIATVSRFLHAAGMFLIENVSKRHPLRFIGALGTYICLFALGGMLLLQAFQS